MQWREHRRQLEIHARIAARGGEVIARLDSISGVILYDVAHFDPTDLAAIGSTWMSGANRTAWPVESGRTADPGIGDRRRGPEPKRFGETSTLERGHGHAGEERIAAADRVVALDVRRGDPKGGATRVEGDRTGASAGHDDGAAGRRRELPGHVDRRRPQSDRSDARARVAAASAALSLISHGRAADASRTISPPASSATGTPSEAATDAS